MLHGDVGVQPVIHGVVCGIVLTRAILTAHQHGTAHGRIQRRQAQRYGKIRLAAVGGEVAFKFRTLYVVVPLREQHFAVHAEARRAAEVRARNERALPRVDGSGVFVQRALIINTGADLVIAAFAAEELDRARTTHRNGRRSERAKAVAARFSAFRGEAAVAGKGQPLILLAEGDSGTVGVQRAHPGEVDGVLANQVNDERTVRMDARPDTRLIDIPDHAIARPAVFLNAGVVQRQAVRACRVGDVIVACRRTLCGQAAIRCGLPVAAADDIRTAYLQLSRHGVHV